MSINFTKLLAVFGFTVFCLLLANNAKSFVSDENSLENLFGGKCEECVVRYVSASIENGGNSECNHGPELDPNDCAPDGNESCFELNGGVPDPGDPEPDKGDGKCMCFECGKSDDCESQVYTLTAFCGFEDEVNCGVCKYKTQSGYTYHRKYYPAATPNNEPCAYGENGFETVKACGKPPQQRTLAYSCVSSNCSKQGTTAQLGDLKSYTYVCDDDPDD